MTSETIKVNFLSISAFPIFVIFTCVLMQMFDWGEPYRFFAYLNLVLVLLLLLKRDGKSNALDIKPLFYIVLIPVGFAIMHVIAVMHWEYTREMRRMLLAVFLLFGIWGLSGRTREYVNQHSLKLSIVLLILYVSAQAISLWNFGNPYGTTKNPHYLAFFSAASLMFTIYIFFKLTNPWRWLLVFPFLLLGVLLVKTGSRPTWIALIFSGLFTLLFIEPKLRKFATLLMVVVLATLTLTNAGNFAVRFGDLLLHLNTEERVIIWQDTWRMLNDNTMYQWLFGHGLNAFEEGFKHYSRYHLMNNDFNSPHNFILEVLYTSGVVGFLLVIALIFSVYRGVFLLKAQVDYQKLALLLLALFTANLITVSITVPFFSGYNLNMIAVILGIVMYCNAIAKSK